MKINDFDSGSKVQKYQSNTKPAVEHSKERAAQPVDQKDTAKTGSSADNVQLSERSLEIVRVKEAVASAPEIRQDKVDELKARLADGTYEAEAEEIADRLIKAHLEEIV